MKEQREGEVVLSSYLVKRAVTAKLQATGPQEILEEMVSALVKAGQVDKNRAKKLVRSLMEREKQGSTGIGGGCAIPHCPFEGVDGLILLIARSEQGVDYDCVTGEKVHVFVLVVYPPGMDQKRRAVLGRVLELCRTTNWLKFLRVTQTAREIIDLVSEYDNEA